MSMGYFDIEAPDITNTERTGYPDGKGHNPWCWCDRCRREIYRGEEYYDIDGRFLCAHCMGQFRYRAGESMEEEYE